MLVTGAAGFIGSHFVRSNISKYEIRCIDNGKTGDWSRLPDNVLKMDLDLGLAQDDNLLSLLQDVQVLVHLAAEKHNSSITSPDSMFRTNVTATERLFRLAQQAGVEDIVYSSSLYVYGSHTGTPAFEKEQVFPTTNYGISKLAGELLLRKVALESGIRWHCPRFYFIYGPNQFALGGYKSVIVKNFENAIEGRPLTINGDGNQKLDYVYIDDLIGILNALIDSKRSTGVLNVASGIPRSINEIIEIISSLTSEKKIVYLPKDSTHGTARFGSTQLLNQNFGNMMNAKLEDGLKRIWMEHINGN